MPDFIKNDLEDYLRMESTIDIVNVVASTKLAERLTLPNDRGLAGGSRV